MSPDEAGYIRSLMDTDLSHEALERFEHLEEHVSQIESRLNALEGGGARSEEEDSEGEDSEEEDSEGEDSEEEEDEGTGGIV
jgi:ribosomal protein L12E/L44/L45/RPP1/RPP2